MSYSVAIRGGSLEAATEVMTIPSLEKALDLVALWVNERRLRPHRSHRGTVVTLYRFDHPMPLLELRANKDGSDWVLGSFADKWRP